MSQEMMYDSSIQVERNCSIGEYMVKHNSYHLSTTQNPNCVRALLNLMHTYPQNIREWNKTLIVLELY